MPRFYVNSAAIYTNLFILTAEFWRDRNFANRISEERSLESKNYLFTTVLKFFPLDNDFLK